MPRNILLGFALLAVAACAAPSKSAVVDERPGQSAGTGSKREESHPVFVGHGSDGEMVMASTHYDSMNGLAVGSQQLGVTTGRDEGGDFVCKRETVTGTHMPQWICRYKKDIEEDRRSTQRMLDNMPKACMERACNQ